MNNADFRNRVKAAALQYALYIQGQPNNPNSRSRWAQNMLAAPDQIAGTLAGGVVMNVNVQSAGEAVTDQNLAAAVQAVSDLQM